MTERTKCRKTNPNQKGNNSFTRFKDLKLDHFSWTRQVLGGQGDKYY